MAQPLPERVSFPGMEEEMLKLWEKLDAFKTSLELSKGKPEFTVSEVTRTSLLHTRLSL